MSTTPSINNGPLFTTVTFTSAIRSSDQNCSIFASLFRDAVHAPNTHSLVPRCGAIYCFLVLGNRRVNFVGPRKDTTLQVQYLAKACALQKFNRFGRALAAAAMGHNLPRAIEFTGAFGKVTEWYQVSTEIANLILVRLANVEDVQIVAAVETGL